MKKIVLIFALVVAILTTGCATPPVPNNDPNVPDNGVIILNNNPYPSYCQYPYQIGSYCDPFWGQIYWQYEVDRRYRQPHPPYRHQEHKKSKKPVDKP